ncbi:hypothetical protein Btru_042505 [Bulinus truncatus]|nr:hypothetical protein Btru_042505 [Bulinus truncatus]
MEFVQVLVKVGKKSLKTRPNGICLGSKSSACSNSSRTYADNSLNRQLGRVGLDHGTAVHRQTDSSRGSSASSNSSKTYVDNVLNRRLGRVGQEHGTAVYRQTEGSSSSSVSSRSSQTYKDNALNRSLGRVGKPVGSAVNQQSSATESNSGTKNYVDNAHNRQLGRVGQPYGKGAQQNSGSVYKDNPINRKLGRVGQPIERQPVPQAQQNKKVYVDNDHNRKLNRVGLPLGSVPVRQEDRVHKDTALNRKLGRVGLAWGTGKAHPQAELLNQLTRLKHDEDIPDNIARRYEEDSAAQDLMERVLEMMNRQNEICRRAEEGYYEDANCDADYNYERSDDRYFDAEDRNVNTEDRQVDYVERSLNSSDRTTRIPDRNVSERVNEKDSYHHTSVQVINKYKGKVIDYNDLQMRHKVGHGSFGDVYSADWMDGQLVAVKKLRYQQMSNKRVRQFEKEITLFCTLDHPNIVRFIGACIVRLNLAMVMEFMESNLHDALHIKEIVFEDKDTIQMTKDICNGMSYLHNKNIAHCDMKPSNLLLNNIPTGAIYDPEKPVLAKLTDFGLSLIKSETETTSSNMDAVRNVGTPRYSAPEVLRGEMLDIQAMMKTDVYSLGLTLLELLLEEIPFESLNIGQLRKQVGEKGLKPKLGNEHILDKEFKSLLDGCLSTDPDDRPMADELCSFVTTGSLF